jgi:DNA-directed RNA polymerase subunit RPC12/RpoP
MEKTYRERHIKELMLIDIKDYNPDPIAIKLGYVCSVCNGMKITPLYGEKVCTCNNEYELTDEVKEWRRNRERLALVACAQISYSLSFVCNECNKLNKLFGQTEETANTCGYCGHKQSPKK